MGLTLKQEAFVGAYQETGNASEAYRRAYNTKTMSEKTVNEEACKLVKNPKVATRLSELQQLSAERHNITVDSLTQMTMKAFAEAQRIAPTTGQMQTSSMIKAAEFLGKLHGLVIDKSEITGADGATLIPVLNVSVSKKSDSTK